MGRLNDISDEKQARIDRELDAFFAFTEDVFADPSILDKVPNDADVAAVRLADREPGRRYDIETPNTVATVTAPTQSGKKPTRIGPPTTGRKQSRTG